MRRCIPVLVLSLAVAAGAPASASAQQVPSWVNEILAAAQLPVVTVEARNEGVANAEINAVLDAMKSANVPAHEAAAVFDSARAVRREHGPVDNFGAFVQSQLAAGKRGRALAAAIRAEHARVGKGKGAQGAKGQAKSENKAGRDTTKGRSAGDTTGRGRPTSSAEKGNRGRGNPVRPDR